MDFMPREASIIRTLVELADNLVEEYDVVEVLCNLSDRCVETLNVDSAGVMLASASGDLQVVASSSDAMRSLELFEIQANEGPCLDAFRSGEPILNHELLQNDLRWPRDVYKRQELPCALGSSPMLPCTFVATITRDRSTVERAFPTITSDSPCE